MGFAGFVLKAHRVVFGIDNGLLGADVDGVILGNGNILGATGSKHEGAYQQHGKNQGGLSHGVISSGVTKKLGPANRPKHDVLKRMLPFGTLVNR